MMMNVHIKAIVVVTIIFIYHSTCTHRNGIRYTLLARVMLGGANLNNTSCSHIVWCITLVLTKNAHVRSIRIPFKRLAFGSRELLQASSARYLQDSGRVERREGDLHYNLNRKSLASPCCLDEQQFDHFLKYWTIGVLWRYTESWYFVRKN